jgi:hypothetical protein
MHRIRGHLATSRLILAINRSNSTGLVSNSSHPAARAFSLEPLSACAESAITGMDRVIGSALSCRAAGMHAQLGNVLRKDRCSCAQDL